MDTERKKRRREEGRRRKELENCAGRAAEKQQKLKPLSEIQDGHMKGAGLNLAANGPAPRLVLLGLLGLACSASS